MLLVGCPSVTGWYWCGWAESQSTWGPVLLMVEGGSVSGGFSGCAWAYGRLNVAP